jgi:uncharacterized protein (DUF302 family)
VPTPAYGRRIQLDTPFAEAVARTRAALATQGFGILAEMDVQATLRAKLAHDIGPYLILGACNPPLARQAIDVEPDIGLLLPCNVLLRAPSPAGPVTVAALDPDAALGVVGNPAIAPVAADAKRRLDAALDALAAA